MLLLKNSRSIIDQSHCQSFGAIMHISEVHRMREDKDHLARYEGKHPANYNERDRMMRDNFGGLHGVDYNSHGVELQ